MEEAEGGEEVTEMWYRLPAEEDTSAFFPTLSETGVRGEQTSFPSMEEGTIQSEADLREIPGGRTLPLQLDFQDSRLSPCLPLLTSGSIPGHKFFEDTLFQQTETEFAPLRASLDMSEFPGPGSMSLQMTDALRLTSKEVLMVQEEDTLSSTQNYQEKSPDGHLDLSSGQYLSEHPLNVSHGDKEDDTITENIHSDSGVLKAMGQPSVEDLMAEDGAFLGSNVPAPVLLELLEKEVGLSAGSGSSSRRSSQTVSTSEADNIDVPSQEPREDRVSILEAQARTKTPTGLNLEEETFRDSSEINFEDPELEKANLSVPGHLDQSGITLRQSSPGLRDELQKQLCAEIQQERKKREMSKFHKSRNDNSPSSQNLPDLPENITKPSYSGEDTVEEQPRGELTGSSHCIERGHKETDLSQAVNTPIDEASFIGRLAYPISQSTPGTFSMNRKQLSGRIQQIKAKLTGSDMSLNEEPNSSSSNPNVASSGVHQSVQSSQGYPESSDSQRSPSPQRRKIQSLPSLNYIEKVGSWNTNQSFDTLVLRGLTGVSPKKLAYNAVADSLNRMLSKQTDRSISKKGLDASFKGTSSMTNLNVEHIESSSASKLTRSQSYNSVITAVGGNHALKRTEENIDPVAEEGKEAAKLSTIQPFESLQTHVFLSRDISGNETKHLNKGASMGKNDTAHSPPDYVEHLEKSNHEQEKRLDESSRPLNKSLITMEHFSDVSLDQEFSGSSHTSDHVDVLQDSVGSSVLGMSHHQGEPLMQVWSGEGATREKEWTGEGAAPEKEWTEEKATPEDEFNIEERIPTYLRNLGINQSPTTILMPFDPKGPIREPEFSPSELRTIKSSNATPNRSMRLSEGESQNGANISQSSLYSTASSTSVSIPMGSEAGPGSPLPTELSPQFSSRCTNDRPISQDDTATRGIRGDQEVYSVQALDGERRQVSSDTEELNDLGATRQVLHDIQEVADDSTLVEQVIEQFESAGPEVGQANLEHLELGSFSSSWKKPHHMDSTNDSFVGSKTLKEIRKLLAEADDVKLDRTTSDFNPKSSLRDPSITSPAVSQSFRDSLKSGASNSRSASPLELQLNNLSWDTSFNSSVTSDNLLYNRSSAKADLHWKDPIAGFSQVGDSFYLKDISKDGLHLPAPFSLHKHGRSEPEGSSEATAIRMGPASVLLQDSRVRRTVDLREEGLRSEQLLSSVTRAVGGLKQVLDVTGSSNLRSTGEESNASSGDTLAAQVKSLLKNGNVRSTGEESDASSGDSLAGQVKSLLKSGKLRSTGEESDASSGDSLAARVKSLLKSNTLSSTSQVRQTAEDKNQRSRGSVKLKLAGQPPPADGDLSEEDRRRIEEIKRELLDQAKGAEKSHQHSTFEPGPSRGSEHFRLQLTPSPQLDQYHVTDAQDSSEDHIIPLPASTRCGSSDVHPSSMTVGNIKAVATVALQSYEPSLISSQLQQGLIPDLHTPLADRSASDRDRKTAYANKYGEEATKPIASITFSSRKRSSPLPTSTRLETAELSSATRHFDYAKSLADPYYKDRSHADPFDKDRSHADPFDKDRSHADPSYDNRPRADPYYKDRSHADPYNKDRSHADPYNKDEPHSDPYYNYKPRADPYDKDRPHADPYYKDRPHANQFDKDKSQADPYYKDNPLSDPYYKDKPGADPYDKDRPHADPYYKDRPHADQYDKDTSQADPYYKDKPCADPYEKEKPHVDPQYKAKQLTDLLYKDNQPSEASRSNFIQCPSPMDNMMPQNPTILDLTDKGGVLNQSKTVVSEHRGQSEVFKNRIQPDHSSMVDRNASMNEDSFSPPVARPSKPIGLQEDIAGPSHSALVAGRSMIELPPQILNVSTKEWKIYPEPIPAAKIQKDGTHEFPSQDLKTEPTSPTRKALSCIRVTISPKEDLNISSVMMATGTGDEAQTFRSSSAMAKNEQFSSHGLSSVPPGSPYFLHSPPSASQGEGRTNSEGNVHMEDKENISDKATMKQRQVPLYDATTQITTESPEKTTFSAEIYIDGSLKEASSSTVIQTQKTPEGRSRTPFFSLSRTTDQPLLRPYRPPGSPELFYTAAINGGSRMSPVSTIESSHPDSNDAVSPKFPAEVLGSAAEKISDTSIPHHSDGIYSKDRSPKIVQEDRATEKRTTPVTGPFHDDNKASYCSLQHRVSHPEPASKDFQREKRDLRSVREDEEFFPLKPEVDYAPEQQSSTGLLKKTGHHDISDYPRRRDQQEQTRGTPLHSPSGSWDFKLGVREKHVRYEDHSFSSDQPTNPTKSFQKTESILSQSAISNHSLDDLWARYTDRRRSHLSESSNKLEVSLVERLDRLARLLQNPKPYSATKDDKDGEQVLKVNNKDHEKRRATKKEEREKWYLRKFGVDAQLVNGTSENQDDFVSRLSESASSERVLHGDSYSDLSSEVRSSATEESAGGSEAATQTDSASTFATSSTISTIDTVRLINAFGPERVRPSSKLSRLYNTIDLQKKRSEGTSKKASRLSASRGNNTMEIKDLHKSLNKMADTDSVSSSSSWEPVMRSKNGCKVLNKGIQAGDLEIVTSATKRHTRDVGTTFPSPGGEMLKPLAEQEMPAHSGSGVRRPKTKQYIPPGLSWFVPADGMRCDAPKENKRSGPGPAWYESTTNAKPWREPLRERNQQGPAIRRGGSLNIGSEPGKDDKMVQPFVRATLQELLKAHRPDFIFQSGERVKRLQLLTKERKLQNIFQSEREALFNQPERRGRPPYHTSYKESKTSQKMKNIPRSEMVQRSKRIYEQLPEIKKRKEEEKRRSEYETYRLKAQLFRKKVTNHILGRKTPWN